MEPNLKFMIIVVIVGTIVAGAKIALAKDKVAALAELIFPVMVGGALLLALSGV